MDKDLEYKEDGKTLKGFSQIDLDDLNANIINNTDKLKAYNKALWSLVVIAGAFLLYVLFMTYYIISNSVINNIVNRCV